MTKEKMVGCLVVRTSRKVIMASELGRLKPLTLMEEKPLAENLGCKKHGGKGRGDWDKVKEL